MTELLFLFKAHQIVQWWEYLIFLKAMLVKPGAIHCTSPDLSPSPPSLYPALIGDSHVMGWGSKAIEIRAVDNGQLDGVFMHKRTQKLRFLCERNDKVSFPLNWYSTVY